MRSVLGMRRDPLCLFLLATLGVAHPFGCAGRSASNRDSGGTGGGAAQGGTGPLATEGVLDCESPVAYLGDASGLEACADGAFVHRVMAGKCEPTPLVEGRYTKPFPDALTCTSDSECTGTPKGRCYTRDGFGAACISTCESDTDCGAGELCLCDPVVNHCVNATCRSDADCGPGLLCTNVKQACSNDLGIFRCQTADDQCTATCPNGSCELTGDAAGAQRKCLGGTGGTCGRPFLVAGRALVAALDSSRDWLDASLPEPELVALSPELRETLAAGWTQAALMEHASIAAFARFALELLALGAPPSLVSDATLAMADEQRHAATCFALASAYAGAPLGPGRLDVTHALGAVDLERVAVTTFLEGCIGETVAAVEARELAARAVDGVVAETLRTIAADESRHSALAWRFLRWALERGGARLARTVTAVLERELDSVHRSCDAGAAAASDEASAHGVLSASARHALRADVLREIVAPCLLALAPTRSAVRAAEAAGG